MRNERDEGQDRDEVLYLREELNRSKERYAAAREAYERDVRAPLRELEGRLAQVASERDDARSEIGRLVAEREQLLRERDVAFASAVAVERENAVLRDQLSSRFVRQFQRVNHVLRTRGLNPKRLANVLFGSAT